MGAFGPRLVASAAAVFAFGLPAATPARPPAAVPAMAKYEVRLVGTVRAVHRRARTFVVAYAPLETAPGGTRALRVRHVHELDGVVAGEAISAIADTRHSPWTVRDVRALR